jgi:MoxR-like ATPase
VLDESPTGERSFRFIKGPVFTQLLMADEINRASPRTQSALLQAMQEKHVTVAGVRHDLPAPFHVLATQNPIEQEGTYPLPEAQLDRFMYKVHVDFLNRAELNEVVTRTILRPTLTVAKVLDAERILDLRRTLDKVVVADPIRDYATRLVLATHPESEHATDLVKRYVRWGASPRAAQALLRGGRVRALAEGRAHVAIDDLRHFASEALGHRVLLNYDGQADNVKTLDVVTEVLAQTPEISNVGL